MLSPGGAEHRDVRPHGRRWRGRARDRGADADADVRRLHVEHGVDREVGCVVLDNRQPDKSLSITAALGAAEDRVDEPNQRVPLGIIGKHRLQVVAGIGQPVVLEAAVGAEKSERLAEVLDRA